MADSLSEFDKIVIGECDAQKREVLDVYVRQTGRYAVYQTATRVVVQYADDPLVQRIQRKRMARLATLRSELDGTLNSWRRTRGKGESEGSFWGERTRNRLYLTSRQFDMRIASALVETLEGDADTGIAILEKVKIDLQGEQASRARLSYLVWTLLSAILFLLICLGVWQYWSDAAPTPTYDGAMMILRGVAAGILGALYSISMRIEKRDLRNDMRSKDQFTDAFVRIGMGALGAFVLECFLLSGAIQISFGTDIRLVDTAEPTKAAIEAAQQGLHIASWPISLIAGFLAGFAERLVPDLLNSYAITKRPDDPQAPLVAEKPLDAGSAAAAAADEGLPDNEDDVITAPSDEEHLDGCDVDLADEATVTPDDKLPAASGGVAQQ